jgi:hypothetical protein
MTNSLAGVDRSTLGPRLIAGIQLYDEWLQEELPNARGSRIRNLNQLHYMLAKVINLLEEEHAGARA